MAKPLLRLIWLFLSGTTPWKPKGFAFSSKTEVKGEQRAQNKKLMGLFFLLSMGMKHPSENSQKDTISNCWSELVYQWI